LGGEVVICWFHFWFCQFHFWCHSTSYILEKAALEPVTTWWNCNFLPIQAQQVEYCRPISLLHARPVQKLQKCLNFTNITYPSFITEY
jgi:hypothetical protein